LNSAVESNQITPTGDLELDGSVNVTVAFSKKGKQYSFNFENRRAGLVLKD
jgi:hypothetical protein